MSDSDRANGRSRHRLVRSAASDVRGGSPDANVLSNRAAPGSWDQGRENPWDHPREKRQLTGLLLLRRTVDRRQLFLPVCANYFCRSGSRLPLLLFRRLKVTGGDRQLFARCFLAAGFFSSVAWRWAWAVR